jgi:hypothetical protein
MSRRAPRPGAKEKGHGSGGQVKPDDAVMIEAAYGILRKGWPKGDPVTLFRLALNDFTLDPRKPPLRRLMKNWDEEKWRKHVEERLQFYEEGRRDPDAPRPSYAKDPDFPIQLPPEPPPPAVERAKWMTPTVEMIEIFQAFDPDLRSLFMEVPWRFQFSDEIATAFWRSGIVTWEQALHLNERHLYAMIPGIHKSVVDEFFRHRHQLWGDWYRRQQYQQKES